MAATIKIVSTGPSGTIQYTEKGGACEFYWEFGGGDTVATVWVPAEDKWDAKYPWASGRRKEIIEAVAAETRKKQAPKSSIKWEVDRFHLVNS